MLTALQTAPPAPSAHPFLVSLRQGTRLVTADDGRVSARTDSKLLELGALSPGPLAAIAGLAKKRMTLEDLIGVAQGVDPTSVAELLMSFTALSGAGLIEHTLVWPDRPVARLVPVSPGFTYTYRPVDPAESYVAVPFLRLDDCGDGFSLAAPTAPARVDLHEWWATALVHLLLRSPSLSHASAELTAVDPEARNHLVSLLVSAGLLVPSSEDPPEPTGLWERADLEFHMTSRRGFRDGAFGATFPGKDRASALPALKSPMSGTFVDLATPDIAALARDDPPFAHVLETRRSHRQFGAQPISQTELAEFLYRTLRVRAVEERPGRAYQTTSRPTPSGGACHELEVYLAVDRCGDLARGLYHYAPDAHRLYRIGAEERDLDRLLDDAVRSSGAPARPQVLVILSARFGRVTWKYQRMGYALVLKHVGVAMQTMYLAATAMGLAGCALGGGDSVLFARMAGTDTLEETSVGEFMLGSLPDEGEAGGEC